MEGLNRESYPLAEMQFPSKASNGYPQGDKQIDMPEILEIPDTCNGIEAPEQQNVSTSSRNTSHGEFFKERYELHDTEPSFTKLGKFYRVVSGWSSGARFIFYCVPVALILAIPVIVGILIPYANLGEVRIVWIFVWLLVSWGGLWGSHVCASLLPHIVAGVIGVISPKTAKLHCVIAGIAVPLTIFGWAFVSWISFIPVMTRNPDQVKNNDLLTKPWEETLHRVLSATLVSSLVFAGEKLIVKVLAVNFQKVQFRERIAIDKWVVGMLAELYLHSRRILLPFCKEVFEEDYTLMGVPYNKSHKRSHVDQLKRVMGNVNKIGTEARNKFGHVTGANWKSASSSDAFDTLEALNSETRSAALAKRIWISFVPHGRHILHFEDFQDVMGLTSGVDATRAFDYLDTDGQGAISLGEMITAVVDISKEHNAVAHSIRDVDLAIQRLDELLLVIVLVIIVFVFVAFFNRSFTTMLATAGTTLLSLSFIFAATLQEVMASCVFLFVKHPFDVGDRVNFQNEHYTVKEMALLSTVFRQADGRIVQASNALLNTLIIQNVDRSQSMSEHVRVLAGFETTMDDIERLRGMLQVFIDSHPRNFDPKVTISVSNIVALSQIELSVIVQHKSNWKNEVIYAQRRSIFMYALVEALKAVLTKHTNGNNKSLGDDEKPVPSASAVGKEYWSHPH